jgi:hypothetical protein
MNRHHPSLANHDLPERESPGHDRLAARGMPSIRPAITHGNRVSARFAAGTAEHHPRLA